MAEAQLMTLIELAKKHGHYRASPVAEDPPFSADHLVAQTLNGWLAYERNTGELIKMEEAEYLDAIAQAKLGVASEFVNKRPQAKEVE